MQKEKVVKYFKEIRKIYLNNDYTEWTLRTPFENFIKSLDSNYKLIQEPKRAAKLGAPDFKAFFKSAKVGFIETKDINENLDKILESEQIKKYVGSIDNLIVTNYIRFILIRNQEKIFDLDLFHISDLDNKHFSISDDKIKSFFEIIDEFFRYKTETINTAEELARELAKKAKLLKDLAREQLNEDFKNKESTSSIYDFYLGIKELIKDISPEDCADAYAQTVTYSLFISKKSCSGELNRESAYSYIPKNIGVIKRIFINISGSEFPSNISWIIDDIVDILNSANLDEIFTDIDKRGKKDKDPIIFLYEDFLNYYEPEKKKQLGVYYTPRPVVNFIVNSVNLILKKYFDKPNGLADSEVNVLDPAIGTGTFFWIAYLVVFKELKAQGLRGMINEKIEEHILKHFYGFETLITPYVISHLKLTYLLKQWRYRLKENERIQVYLTNTLEPTQVHGLIPFMKEITEESRIANQIKLKKPILVIIGNPPYSGISANKGKWIDDLLKKGYTRADGSKDDGYYIVDGKPLGEKKVWLQDDYVKFIRFAQWKIDMSGEGVVGFITNHSYLDNPTFRGMRESLIQSFDRIYILNLHGNALKKEKCPDGSNDENVFDIKQGVAIALFIKNEIFKDKKVFYADLYGLREKKYHWLDRQNINTVQWQEIEPISPYYFFVPRDSSLLKDYEKFWKITDIFPINGVGMTTARDSFVIDFDKKKLLDRIRDFKNSKYSDDELHRFFNIRKKKGWSIRKAWNMLQPIIDEELGKYVVPVLYRPFDQRWIFYHDSVVWRTVKRIMKHMMQENLALCIGRQWNVIGSDSYDIVFSADNIIDLNLFRRGGEQIFPLYLYSNKERKTNFNSEFIKYISDKYDKKPSPEEIFYYIYAVLHSPTYRKKYEEFLQYDFPRIPFVDDYETFKRFSEFGKELVELHLMKKRLPVKTKFDIIGSNIVEKIKYKDGKLWINKEQYFDNVAQEVYNFYIGGYQVLDKWLKSRKNRKLSSKEIEQFLQIIEIIKKTIEIMGKLEEV